MAAAVGCTTPPPPELQAQIQVLPRNHQELRLSDDGPPLPRYLGREAPLSLCIATDAAIDTSQWDVRLELDGKALSEDFAPPSVGLGNVLCFDAPIPARFKEPREARLGGELRDRFDGSRSPLPELAIYLDPEDSAYQALRRDILSTVRDQHRDPIAIAQDLLLKAKRASAAAFPYLRVRASLIAAYFLRRGDSEDGEDRARQILADLPPWIEGDTSSFWGSQAALARADLALGKEWNLNEAWIYLSQAERRQARIADPTWIESVRRQSEILVRVDAAGEGVARLREAIDDCGRWPCNPLLLAGAQVTLGWLTLLDPQATMEDFERAREISRAALQDISAETFPRERANLLVNLAHLTLMLEEDPEPELDRAKDLLEMIPDTAGRREVEDWIQVVRGSAALKAGNPRRALRICVELANRAEVPLVAAWSWGCSARALRRVGDLPLAAAAFDQALRHHAYATPQRLGQSIALGISRRSEDYYSAARLAVDRGDLRGAWDLLTLLDRLGDRTSEGALCTGEGARESDLRHRERKELLKKLAALEKPAGDIRRAQRKPLQQSIRQRLQELWRQQSTCVPFDETFSEEPRFRAFLVDDELLLLELDPELGPRLVKRTPLRAADLRKVLLRTTASQSSVPPLSDSEWRRLLTPVALALVPSEPQTLDPVTTFALHGILQEIPLSALPVSGEQGDSQLWLSSFTIPIHTPARTGKRSRIADDARPLFVVDPLGDLLSADAADDYRRLFPESEILYGGAATHEAFRQSLGAASWLHIDTHGSFDAAYPELSSLQMADRPVTFIELAELPLSLRFANLSSCLTGRWPVTADSGHYGIAGLLLRRGVLWVIASRVELDNRFAKAFNLRFYQALGDDANAALAFREALEATRQDFPASTWGALLLLGRPTKRGAIFSLPHSPTGEGISSRPHDQGAADRRRHRVGETK